MGGYFATARAEEARRRVGKLTAHVDASGVDEALLGQM
jgi:hypothetical protein